MDIIPESVKIQKMEQKGKKIDAKKTARDLAISIYDFLVEERYKRTGWSKRQKKQLDYATDNLEKVYKIGFMDYVLLKVPHPLPEVYSIGCRPVKVKDRLKAEQHKRRGNVFMADCLSFKSADMEYSMAIHHNPGNAVYWCNRAASRIGQLSYDSAISDCEKALEIDRAYTKALAWQGIALALAGHPGKAIKCYRRALRIEPKNEVCLANMDLIERKFNRTTLRILEPLNRYGRHFVRIAANVVNCQVASSRLKTCSSGRQEQRDKRLYLQCFKHGTLD